MYIKRYTMAVLVFMVLLGWYVYAYVTQDIRAINFFGTELPAMPIALWIVVPVFFLYIASVLHISYYALIGTLKRRKFQKDYQSFVEALRDAFLGKTNRYTQYKTSQYSVLGRVVENSTLTPSATLEEVGNEKIDAVLKLIREISNGNIVELKKMQLERENPLVVQNNLNRLAREKVTPEDILSRSERYALEVNEAAYVKLVATAPFYAIEKYKAFMSKAALLVIAGRINADEHTLEVANDSLLELAAGTRLSETDYLHLSRAMAANALPDQRIRLLEAMATANEEAMEAYLYTLFDLEMIAPADEILDNSQSDEFVMFKAYRALKECGRHYSLDMFIPALKSA